MNILVTGGAGYVGSIVTSELLAAKHRVIIVDNLQQGYKQAVREPAEFIHADICDFKSLDEIFSHEKIDAVMHMAAETVVEYSMSDPKRYFHTNIIGGLNLLNAMVKHHVNKIIFSSSAAVYGEPLSTPIVEDHPKNPINSYGESKLMFERILRWYGSAYGLQHISFRYFNAAGAIGSQGESHRPETHLIPLVLAAAVKKNLSVQIFGNDYPTKDGSCIRDYVHVKDIAQAHILCLEKSQELSGRAYNLGNSTGYSVLEIVKMAEKVTGRKIPVKFCPRRPGDPAVLVASSARARDELGWKPRSSGLENIVAGAWRWLQERPAGYDQ
jgi:UDP-glucose 4-epimerase